jgi:hypothetical protein
VDTQQNLGIRKTCKGLSFTLPLGERVEEPFPTMEGLEGRAFVRGLKREIRIEREKKRKSMCFVCLEKNFFLMCFKTEPSQT